ncbi:MAG: HlyD family efflux transporter periplasmic adaptor subunit, partial [Flavobacteriales bacterium]|nr:HlyD family efflux transporter periplasmic adaptor subunit [Flavobacteriales bacterium]
SVIAGRIEQWYVREGQRVQAGDTLIRLSEIKEEYLDPALLENIGQQVLTKEDGAGSYMQKVKALDTQIDALVAARELKIMQQKTKIGQIKLKIATDSIAYEAATANVKVANEQLTRFQELYRKNLKSETELEQREVALQNAAAKETETRNALLIARQELQNAGVELLSIEQEYLDKISKAESEKYASLSALYDTEAQITKLRNQQANYKVRSGYYFITAPTNGYVTQALVTGVGETISEGAEVLTLVPMTDNLAVELYVSPMDLPLLQNGQQVRFLFDGWPAFFFSGWPGASYGTYSGKIVAIDNFISENGKFRLLVSPDENAMTWPEGLRIGTGTRAFALLNDVPVWYELWRQLNGFPPDFYKAAAQTPTTNKPKK